MWKPSVYVPSHVREIGWKSPSNETDNETLQRIKNEKVNRLPSDPATKQQSPVPKPA